MKKIAIVYATKFGQTEKIARYMEDKLQQRGFSTQLLNASEKEPLSPEVDGVVYGGPVYSGKFPKRLIQWVRSNRASLDRIPTALFTVSLNAADKRPEARAADRMLIRKLIEQSGFAPGLTASFAGALKYRDYFWPIRLIMRRISRSAGGDTDTSKNYEYTSWPKVDSFLSSFLSAKERASSIVDLADRRLPIDRGPLTKEEWEQVIL
jgi:menaquinone-dependent protoporphyrinogen oxidase